MDKIVPPQLLIQLFNRFKPSLSEECEVLTMLIPLVMISEIIYDHKIKLIFGLCSKNIPEFKAIKDSVWGKRDWNEDHQFVELWK